MRRIKLIVAYDGTNYHGWQYQPDLLTIEGELIRAVAALTREDVVVIGASRTDAGVHAKGNVVVFDTESRIVPERFAYALNAFLPSDIRVIHSSEVDLQWHPRKRETRKTYQYSIYNAQIPCPLSARYAWHYSYPLDLEKMQEAAQAFLGEHDFSSFCSVHSQAEHHVRTIYALDVQKEGQMYRITVTGNGFLYNMVRIIAGTLAAVGAGKMKSQDMEEILAKKSRELAGPTAPANGLVLLGYEEVGDNTYSP